VGIAGIGGNCLGGMNFGEWPPPADMLLGVVVGVSAVGNWRVEVCWALLVRSEV